MSRGPPIRRAGLVGGAGNRRPCSTCTSDCCSGCECAYTRRQLPVHRPTTGQAPYRKNPARAEFPDDLSPVNPNVFPLASTRMCPCPPPMPGRRIHFPETQQPQGPLPESSARRYNMRQPQGQAPYPQYAAWTDFVNDSPMNIPDGFPLTSTHLDPPCPPCDEVPGVHARPPMHIPASPSERTIWHRMDSSESSLSARPDTSARTFGHPADTSEDSPGRHPVAESRTNRPVTAGPTPTSWVPAQGRQVPTAPTPTWVSAQGPQVPTASTTTWVPAQPVMRPMSQQMRGEVQACPAPGTGLMSQPFAQMVRALPWDRMVGGACQVRRIEEVFLTDAAGARICPAPLHSSAPGPSFASEPTAPPAASTSLPPGVPPCCQPAPVPSCCRPPAPATATKRDATAPAPPTARQDAAASDGTLSQEIRSAQLGEAPSPIRAHQEPTDAPKAADDQEEVHALVTSASSSQVATVSPLPIDTWIPGEEYQCEFLNFCKSCCKFYNVDISGQRHAHQASTREVQAAEAEAVVASEVPPPPAADHQPNAIHFDVTIRPISTSTPTPSPPPTPPPSLNSDD